MCLPTVEKFLCYYELKTGVLVIGVIDLVSFQHFLFSILGWYYTNIYMITNIYLLALPIHIRWDYQYTFLLILQIYSLLRSIDTSLNLALGGKTNPFQTPFKGGVQNNNI